MLFVCTYTDHKSFSELVRLVDFSDDETVEDEDCEVGDGFNQDELGPKDVVRYVKGVGAEIGARHHGLVYSVQNHHL